MIKKTVIIGDTSIITEFDSLADFLLYERIDNIEDEQEKVAQIEIVVNADTPKVELSQD